MHVVENDFLHPNPHVIGGVDDEQQHDDRDDRRSENLHDCGVASSKQCRDDQQQADGQRDAGNRRYALMPKMPGAGMSRAQSAHPAHGGSHVRGLSHRGPPITKYPTTKSMSGSVTEPIKVASVSISRSAGSKPCTVSQIRWRMAPSMWWIRAQGEPKRRRWPRSLP